jgi:hypothetical protein
MALPPEWESRHVQRGYFDDQGNPMAGWVEFLAMVPVENMDETVVFQPRPKRVELVEGMLDIDVQPADPDMATQEYTHQVKEHLEYVSVAGQTTPKPIDRTYNVHIPAGEGTFQLGAVDPVPPSSGIVVVGGTEGKSAYQVAKDNGFVGTEAEWLASLEGPEGPVSTVPGPPGPGAFDVWLESHPGGTEEEFLASLQGPPGDVSGLAAVATTGKATDLVDWAEPMLGTERQTEGILPAKVMVACDYNAATDTFDPAPDSRLRRVFFAPADHDPGTLAQERDVWLREVL